jgi:hypothetical protein
MRTTNKWRVAPLLGIIAMAAVIMTACPPEPEPEPPAEAPTGKLYLQADYGRYVGYPVKAVAENIRSASGSVTLVWFDAEKAEVYNLAQIAADREIEDYTDTHYDEYMAKITLTAGSGPNAPDNLTDQVFPFTYLPKGTKDTSTSTYTASTLGTMIKPTKEGSYVAGLVDTAAYEAWDTEQKNNSVTQKTLSLPKFLFSDIIIIEKVSDLDTAIADFLGDWDLVPMNPPWTPVGAPAGTYTEYLNIGDESFRLSSTFRNEGIHWEIKKWVEITGNDLKKGSVTYDKGYKLMVNVLSNNGYTGFTSFNLYYKNAAGNVMVTIVRTNQKEDIVRSYSSRVEPTKILLTD